MVFSEHRKSGINSSVFCLQCRELLNASKGQVSTLPVGATQTLGANAGQSSVPGPARPFAQPTLCQGAGEGSAEGGGGPAVSPRRLQPAPPCPHYTGRVRTVGPGFDPGWVTKVRGFPLSVCFSTCAGGTRRESWWQAGEMEFTGQHRALS